MKHLDIRELWVQGARIEHNIKIDKIPREDNYADVLCSVPRKPIFDTMLKDLGFDFPAPCHGQGGETHDDDDDDIDVLMTSTYS